MMILKKKITYDKHRACRNTNINKIPIRNKWVNDTIWTRSRWSDIQRDNIHIFIQQEVDGIKDVFKSGR